LSSGRVVLAIQSKHDANMRGKSSQAFELDKGAPSPLCVIRHVPIARATISSPENLQLPENLQVLEEAHLHFWHSTWSWTAVSARRRAAERVISPRSAGLGSSHRLLHADLDVFRPDLFRLRQLHFEDPVPVGCRHLPGLHR